MSELDRKLLVEEFKKHYQGKMDNAKLQQAVDKIMSANTSYNANGFLRSIIFYVKVSVDFDDGFAGFKGSGGGAFSPGGGVMKGMIFTDDLTRLIDDTISFEVHTVAMYNAVLFFDGYSNLLGHFESGTLATAIGIGGGKGSWDYNKK